MHLDLPNHYWLHLDKNHKRIIPEAVKNGTIGQLNFVTLVAKRIEYSITKPVDGKGGFLRKILGVKRFE